MCIVKKEEIKNRLKDLKTLMEAYKLFPLDTEHHKMLREGIMYEMLNHACILFEVSIKWLARYRRQYSILTFQLEIQWDYLLNSRYFMKVGYENYERIEKGVMYIEEGIFDKKR